MPQRSHAEHNSVHAQVEAIRSNDEVALGQLYTTNYAKVEAFILNNNGTEEQAKDIFQEAFIALWRNIQLGRFEPQSESSLDGYLYQIAKNKWMDYLRSGQFTKVVRMDEARIADSTVHTEPQEEHEYLAAVKKYFGVLGDNCKEVLRRYYYENESLRDIGVRMGWTEATAKNNKYRCIQKLRELITTKN